MATRTTTFTGSNGAAWSLSDASSWSFVSLGFGSGENAASGYPKTDIQSNRGRFYAKNNKSPIWSGQRTQISTTDATSFTLSSVPAIDTGTAYFVAVVSTLAGGVIPAVPTMSHSAGVGTFTQIDTRTSGTTGNRYRLTVFVYTHSSNVSAGTITANWGAVTQLSCGFSTVHVTGHYGGYRNATGAGGTATSASASLTVTKPNTSLVLSFGGVGGVVTQTFLGTSATTNVATPNTAIGCGVRVPEVSGAPGSPLSSTMTWGGTNLQYQFTTLEVYSSDEATVTALATSGRYLIQAGTASEGAVSTKVNQPWVTTTSGVTWSPSAGAVARKIASADTYLYTDHYLVTYTSKGGPVPQHDFRVVAMIAGSATEIATTARDITNGSSLMVPQSPTGSRINSAIRVYDDGAALVVLGKTWETTPAGWEPSWYEGFQTSSTTESSVTYTGSTCGTRLTSGTVYDAFYGKTGTAGIIVSYSVVDATDQADNTIDFDDFGVAVLQTTSTTLSGAGTITTATAIENQKTSTTLSGAGTITTATAIEKLSTSTTLTGTGAIDTATAVIKKSTSATLDGAGVIDAATATTYRPTSTTLDGTGTITTATAVPTRPTTTTLDGTGSLTSTAVAYEFATTTLDGTGTIEASGLAIRYTETSLTGTGTLSVDADVSAGFTTHTTSTTLSGTGTLTATAVTTQVSSASLAGTGTITPAVTTTRAATITLDGEGTIAVTATVTRSTTTAFSGAGQIAATASRTQATTAALSGTGQITATAAAAHISTASLTGTGTISVTGTLLRFIFGATATETDDAITGSLFRRIDGTTAPETDNSTQGTIRREITGSTAPETDTGSAGDTARLLQGLVAAEVSLAVSGLTLRSIAGQTGLEVDQIATGGLQRVLQGSQGASLESGTGGVLQRRVGGLQGLETDAAFDGSILAVLADRWDLNVIPIA